MQRYLDQLRDDLRVARLARRYRNGERKQYRDEEERTKSERHDHFSKIDAYVGGVSTENLYEVIGFEPEQFPPGHLLTKQQAARLTTEILELLESYRTLADTPPDVPPETVYPELLRAMHGDYLDPGPGGYFHLELCEYEPARCPWPAGYCTCGLSTPTRR